MSEPLYGLRPRTAERLKQKLDDATAVGGGSPSGAAARGVTWVKVTGAAVSGWYPGVVSLDVAGTFSDVTGSSVQVNASGVTLASGTRYTCLRTGSDLTSGLPRFRVVNVPAGAATGGVAKGTANTGAVTLTDAESGVSTIPITLSAVTGWTVSSADKLIYWTQGGRNYVAPMQVADTGRVGYVSLAAQKLGDGQKTVDSLVSLGDIDATGSGTFGGDLDVTGQGTFGGSINSDGSGFFDGDVLAGGDIEATTGGIQVGNLGPGGVGVGQIWCNEISIFAFGGATGVISIRESGGGPQIQVGSYTSKDAAFTVGGTTYTFKSGILVGVSP